MGGSRIGMRDKKKKMRMWKRKMRTEQSKLGVGFCA